MNLKKFVSESSLDSLNENQRKVIELRFGIAGDGCVHSTGKIAKILGVTPERIRQIEWRALMKLRHPERFKK